MRDPSLNTALAAAIETLLNGLLRYDPASRQQLSAMGDILAIECSAPPITLYCRGTDNGLQVMGHCEAPVTTHLKGSPQALLGLLKQPAHLAGSGVELAGNIGLLQQWQALLQHLDIDWEDAISTVLGDIAGPLAASGLRQHFSWLQQQGREQQRLLREYLPEELKVIPSTTELQGFYDDIRQLSQHADRLGARIEQIQQALQRRQNKDTTE